MIIYMENEGTPDSDSGTAYEASVFGFDVKTLAEQVAAEAARQEGFPEQCWQDAGAGETGELAISLTILEDPEEMRGINREYRGVDAPTDVLSFPQLEFEAPGQPVREGSFFGVEPGVESGAEILLGDIVLLVPRVLSQARDYGHSVRREFAFLVAHSCFHLMGYDHETPEEAKVMEEKQEKVLDALGILRE